MQDRVKAQFHRRAERLEARGRALVVAVIMRDQLDTILRATKNVTDAETARRLEAELCSDLAERERQVLGHELDQETYRRVLDVLNRTF